MSASNTAASVLAVLESNTPQQTVPSSSPTTPLEMALTAPVDHDQVTQPPSPATANHEGDVTQPASPEITDTPAPTETTADVMTTAQPRSPSLPDTLPKPSPGTPSPPLSSSGTEATKPPVEEAKRPTTTHAASTLMAVDVDSATNAPPMRNADTSVIELDSADDSDSDDLEVVSVASVAPSHRQARQSVICIDDLDGDVEEESSMVITPAETARVTRQPTRAAQRGSPRTKRVQRRHVTTATTAASVGDHDDGETQPKRSTHQTRRHDTRGSVTLVDDVGKDATVSSSASVAAAAESDGERTVTVKAEGICECAICCSLLALPVTLQCGHSFCKVCVAGIFKHSPTVECALCREKIRTLTEKNIALQHVIDSVVEQLPLSDRKDYEARVKKGKRCRIPHSQLMKLGQSSASTATRPRLQVPRQSQGFSQFAHLLSHFLYDQ
eukprot:m.51545 g.51545  ORF g.51545 m.51545 type:complete len:442 (+) comp11243_c1_seq1:109-1434(+)